VRAGPRALRIPGDAFDLGVPLLPGEDGLDWAEATLRRLRRPIREGGRSSRVRL